MPYSYGFIEFNWTQWAIDNRMGDVYGRGAVEMWQDAETEEEKAELDLVLPEGEDIALREKKPLTYTQVLESVRCILPFQCAHTQLQQAEKAYRKCATKVPEALTKAVKAVCICFVYVSNRV